MVKHVKFICAALVFFISGCGGHQTAATSDTPSAQESVPAHESEIDPKGVTGLVNFLARNDCSEMQRHDAFEACYERTRLRLIQTTQSLEEAEYRINQLTTRKGKVL